MANHVEYMIELTREVGQGELVSTYWTCETKEEMANTSHMFIELMKVHDLRGVIREYMKGEWYAV